MTCVGNTCLFLLLLVSACHCKLDISNEVKTSDQSQIEKQETITNNPGVQDDMAETITTDDAQTDNVTNDLPVILWWTGRLFHAGQKDKIKCGNNICYNTKNRKYIEKNRVVIWFYGTDIEPEDMPLPKMPGHEWAIFHEESPMNNYMLSHIPMIKLFNHTATFRRASDFPLTTQHIPSIEYLTSRKPIPIKKKNEYKIKHSLAPVLYVQSHCDVASDRDRYVEELMKYIQVDSVGSCLNNKELPNDLKDPVEGMGSEDFHDYISRYKFHLAFENAICDDYMTEKMFRPLHVGSVPIYSGSPQAEDWVPNNHAIIMANKFSSPKDLADFLIELDSNDEEYEKYLQFKEPNGVTNSFLIDHMKKRKYNQDIDMINAHICHLCEEANKRMQNEREHKKDPSIPLLPPKTADRDHLHCPQPHTSIGVIEDFPVNDRWRQQYWAEDYWTGWDKAQTLEEMVNLELTDSSMFEKYWMEKVHHRYNDFS